MSKEIEHLINAVESIKYNKVRNTCKKDNRLQRKLLKGEISEAEFNYRKQQVHDEYIIAAGEKEKLELILKKCGGQ